MPPLGKLICMVVHDLVAANGNATTSREQKRDFHELCLPDAAG